MDQTPGLTKSLRLVPLDLQRGLLIILMALDHANFHIAQRHSSGEYWGGYFPVFNSQLGFLTRIATHPCAPGFFFLMGAGMVLFHFSRSKAGWTDAQIRRHFLVRGLILAAIQMLLNVSRVWSTSGSPATIWYVGVLAALGAGMIISIPLLELTPIVLGAIAAWLLVVMEVLVPSPVMWGRNFNQMAGVLLVYGGGREEFWVNYPLLAWVELIVIGMIFGRLLLRDQKKAYQIGIWTGLGCLAGFAALRVWNGFGVIRPLAFSTWTGFFSVVKYPPSMAFTFLTMGVNLIILWVFSQIRAGGWPDWHPLLVFGRTPLFSYVAHIVIYLLLGRIFSPQGTSLGIMYLFWLGGLALLYFPARGYGRLKSRMPADSWIRFF